MKVTPPRSTTTSPSAASIAWVRLADTRLAVDESCSPRIRTRIGSSSNSISTVPLPGATIASSQFLPTIKTAHPVAVVGEHQTLYRGQGHSFSAVFWQKPVRQLQLECCFRAGAQPTTQQAPPPGPSVQDRSCAGRITLLRRPGGGGWIASPVPHPWPCLGGTADVTGGPDDQVYGGSQEPEPSKVAGQLVGGENGAVPVGELGVGVVASTPPVGPGHQSRVIPLRRPQAQGCPSRRAGIVLTSTGTSTRRSPWTTDRPGFRSRSRGGARELRIVRADQPSQQRPQSVPAPVSPAHRSCRE